MTNLKPTDPGRQVAPRAEVIHIPFHGDDLPVVDEGGQPYIVLKPALSAIGVDYFTQIEKLRRRSWARTSRSLSTAVDGKIYEMITCDVRTFLMLLATIDERRVGKDVAPKLIAYQAEVADAIEQYWTKGGAINPRATNDQLTAIIERAKGQAEVLRMLGGIVDGRWLEGKAREVAARALGEEPEPDPNFRPLTVSDYLAEQGMAAAAIRKLAPQFGKKLKAAFMRQHGEMPKTAPRYVDGAQRQVAVYTEADRPLFDGTWEALGAA